MDRVLITGMNGAIAPYVADFLRQKGAHVIASTRDGTLKSMIFGKFPTLACNITSLKSVKNTIKKTRPDVILQFAAVSTLAKSWDDPVHTLMTNTLGTVNFLESLRQLGLGTRLIVVGSREEYGKVFGKKKPVNEKEPLRPINPYGVAKAAASELAVQYFQKYGVQAICTRLFNQTAPIWPERFVDSNWCKQIARIEAGLTKPELKVGKLDTARDFTDCRDIARAYWLLLEKGKAGEIYNICSGKKVRIRDMLKELLSSSKVAIRVKNDPSRIFSDQVLSVWGDNSKLRNATGWKPKIPLEKTHGELLEYWRKIYSV